MPIFPASSFFLLLFLIKRDALVFRSVIFSSFGDDITIASDQLSQQETDFDTFEEALDDGEKLSYAHGRSASEWMSE